LSMSEKNLDVLTSKELKKRGWLHFKVYGSMYQKSGIPDFLAYRNGTVVAIENKNPNGKGRVS